MTAGSHQASRNAFFPCVSWCQQNCLQIKGGEKEELVVDFCGCWGSPPAPENIQETDTERVTTHCVGSISAQGQKGTGQTGEEVQLCPVLDSVEEEGDRRMVAQLTSMLDNPLTLSGTVIAVGSTFLSSFYVLLFLVERLYSLLFVYSHVFLLCMHVFIVFLYPTTTAFHCRFSHHGTNKGKSYLSLSFMSSNLTAIERSDCF